MLLYAYLLLFKILTTQDETAWGYYESIINLLYKFGDDLLWGGFFISLGLIIAFLKGDKKVGNK